MQGAGALPVAGHRAIFSNDEAAHLYLPGFEVEPVDAIIANERICGNYNLSGVGGVGQHLLISGHAGVENDFAKGAMYVSTRIALIDGAILQY